MVEVLGGWWRCGEADTGVGGCWRCRENGGGMERLVGE